MNEITTPYEVGDNIQFKLLDKKGIEHWFPGVIHGIRKYQDPVNNMIQKVTYLIDTGRDTRVDEIVYNPLDREINKRVDAEVRKGKNYHKTLAKVLQHPDLPASSVEVETVRQPEQIELPAEQIRGVE